MAACLYQYTLALTLSNHLVPVLNTHLSEMCNNSDGIPFTLSCPFYPTENIYVFIRAKVNQNMQIIPLQEQGICNSIFILRTILFIIGWSSCEACEKCENYKMKKNANSWTRTHYLPLTTLVLLSTVAWHNKGKLYRHTIINVQNGSIKIKKCNKVSVSYHNLSKFESDPILQTLSYYKYIDGVQHGSECICCLELHCVRDESTMVNNKKDSDIVLMFYIAMHFPAIYLILSDHVVHRLSILIRT